MVWSVTAVAQLISPLAPQIVPLAPQIVPLAPQQVLFMVERIDQRSVVAFSCVERIYQLILAVAYG
jgi:hypothetical protein